MAKASTMDRKDEFIKLRAKDISFSEIAKELDVSKPTLIKWSRELEIEINNQRALELEVLQEKNYVAAKGRMELLGKEIEKVQKELETRDYKDVPTEKLYDVLIKLMDRAAAEKRELTFKEKTDGSDELEDLTEGILTRTREWKV